MIDGNSVVREKIKSTMRCAELRVHARTREEDSHMAARPDRFAGREL